MEYHLLLMEKHTYVGTYILSLLKSSLLPHYTTLMEDIYQQ